MIIDTIYYTKDAYLKTYVIEKSNYIQSGVKNTWQPDERPAVIVVPGGGYNYIADSEDEPVIYHFLMRGYSVFSLHYSIGDESEYPIPLLQLFKSIKYVREHANVYWINPNAITMCGFSAGAHLAGLAATQYEREAFEHELNCKNELFKPNACILCYPITNVTKLRIENSKRVSTWGKMLSNVDEKVDVVNYVTNRMCPTFVWHTRTDGIVPVSQSLELIDKMYCNNVKFESHIFGEGYHGLSTNDILSNYKGSIQNGIVVPNVELWIDMAVNWLNSLFSYNV